MNNPHPPKNKNKNLNIPNSACRVNPSFMHALHMVRNSSLSKANQTPRCFMRTLIFSAYLKDNPQANGLHN